MINEVQSTTNDIASEKYSNIVSGDGIKHWRLRPHKEIML